MTEKEAQKIRSDFTNVQTEKHYAQLLDEAVQKQVPQKPLKDEPSKMELVQTYTCSVCGEDLLGETANYCRRCGQRLDWGGTE